MINNTRKLVKALAKMGTHTVEDLRLEVMSGSKQLFVRNDSVLFTSIVDYPRMRVLELFLAVGATDDMLDLERQAMEFAASIGAHKVRAFARPGWARSPIRHGAWEPCNTVWQRNV